jgi:hypothetical protein
MPNSVPREPGSATEKVIKQQYCSAHNGHESGSEIDVRFATGKKSGRIGVVIKKHQDENLPKRTELVNNNRVEIGLKSSSQRLETEACNVLLSCIITPSIRRDEVQ